SRLDAPSSRPEPARCSIEPAAESQPGPRPGPRARLAWPHHTRALPDTAALMTGGMVTGDVVIEGSRRAGQRGGYDPLPCLTDHRYVITRLNSYCMWSPEARWMLRLSQTEIRFARARA